MRTLEARRGKQATTRTLLGSLPLPLTAVQAGRLGLIRCDIHSRNIMPKKSRRRGGAKRQAASRGPSSSTPTIPPTTDVDAPTGTELRTDTQQQPPVVTGNCEWPSQEYFESYPGMIFRVKDAIEELAKGVDLKDTSIVELQSFDFARKTAWRLYTRAASFEQYCDTSSLVKRVLDVFMEVSRQEGPSSSHDSLPPPAVNHDDDDWRSEDHLEIREMMVQFLHDNFIRNYQDDLGRMPPMARECAVILEEKLYAKACSLDEYANPATITERSSARDVVLHVDAWLRSTGGELFDSTAESMSQKFGAANNSNSVSSPLPASVPSHSAAASVNEQDRVRSWSFHRRLELIQRIYLEFKDACARFDTGSAVDICINALELPRYQTAQFRAVILTWWYSALFAIRDDAVDPQVKERAARFFDIDERVSRALKGMSYDNEEDMSVRSYAMLIRAEYLYDPRHLNRSCSSIEASYRRRAQHYANQIMSDEFPERIELPELVGLLRRSADVKCVFQDCLAISRAHLELLEGPSMSPGVRLDFLGRHPTHRKGEAVAFFPYGVSVGGGSCDCCGRTPAEAGMVALYKCKKCRLSHYCSSTCQIEAWKGGHRDHCMQYGRFEEGDILVLQGLQKASELNALWAKVECKASKGRWAVRLVETPNRVLSIKTKNLRHHRPLK